MNGRNHMQGILYSYKTGQILLSLVERLTANSLPLVLCIRGCLSVGCFCEVSIHRCWCRKHVLVHFQSEW